MSGNGRWQNKNWTLYGPYDLKPTCTQHIHLHLVSQLCVEKTFSVSLVPQPGAEKPHLRRLEIVFWARADWALIPRAVVLKPTNPTQKKEIKWRLRCVFAMFCAARLLMEKNHLTLATEVSELHGIVA